MENLLQDIYVEEALAVLTDLIKLQASTIKN